MMSKTILMIDDDLDFISAERTILENADYTCYEAHSMKEGLIKVTEVQPDLILLDVMMEDISSGFRFAKEMQRREKKHSKKHTPIIVITSVQKLTNLNFNDRIKTFLDAVDDFLDKPVDPRILLNRIEEVLNANVSVIGIGRSKDGFEFIESKGGNHEEESQNFIGRR